MRWSSLPQPLSFAMTQARRQVLLGADPPARLTKRAGPALDELREDRAEQVAPDVSPIVRAGDDVVWWTWAGARANATIASALPRLVDPVARFGNDALRLRSDCTADALAEAVAEALRRPLPAPLVDPRRSAA